SAVSPRPMPSTNRPPEVSCTVAATFASAAGWRVYALVTPVANRRRSVAAAASATPTNGSPIRFCESTNVIPCQPTSSARCAWGTAVPISAIRIAHRSRAPAAWVMTTTIEPLRGRAPEEQLEHEVGRVDRRGAAPEARLELGHPDPRPGVTTAVDDVEHGRSVAVPPRPAADV